MEVSLIKQTFNCYREGKLSKFAFVSELYKLIHSELKYDILIEDRLSKSSFNSYVYMIVPVIHKGLMRVVVIIDDNFIKYQLPEDMIETFIMSINKSIKLIPYDYSAYISNINGREIPKSEALKLMLELSKKCLDMLLPELKERLIKDQVFCDKTLCEAIDDIENDVRYVDIIEKVKIKNLLPETVLKYLDKLLPMALNAEEDTKEVVNATVNMYFDYMISLTTSKADPYPSYKIEDKVVYEELDMEEINAEMKEVLTEEKNKSSIKAKWLKFCVNFLPSGKLTSTLNKIYKGIISDPKISKDEKLLAAAEKYNPSEMNTKGKRRLLKELIDMVPPEKLRIFEKKAKELKDSDDQEKQAQGEKQIVKEEVVVAAAALSPWVVAGFAALVCSTLLITCIVTAAITNLVNKAKANYLDHGNIFKG